MDFAADAHLRPDAPRAAPRAAAGAEGAGGAQPLANLAALRLVLAGESAIDLPRLWFTDVAAVDAFIRLHGFDTDNPLDLRRLGELHHEATVYLTDVHRYRLPLQIEQPSTIHELMLAAASPTLTRLQRFACMTLKTMHILHHISGRELLFNTPISEAQLFESLGNHVFGAIDQMRAAGIGVCEFAAGKKSRASLTTKLMAKRNNLATHIFDRLRFRIVVTSRDDLVHALVYLMRHLVPFNYVLPEQSQNAILSPSDVARVLQVPAEIVEGVWRAPPSAAPPVRPHKNEFTARTFRTISFVADIPLRIDSVAPDATPAIAFVQTEIQLVDEATARDNERGDSAHVQYKKRQRARVRTRLESQGWDPDPALEALLTGPRPGAPPAGQKAP
jgi:uncharacterized protein (TIGR04552 family)